jgi:23S rRNA pseudouridine955/2504/2580 synthase
MRAETLTVAEDEAGMRLDRWFKAHYPALGHVQLQKLLRTGQVRLDGKRVEAATRIAPGQAVRVPPLVTAEPAKPPPADRAPKGATSPAEARAFLKAITLFEDKDVLVLNKPHGLAVQGGSGLVNHLDGMLAALTDPKGQQPRLVHRLDRDTSGVILVAKNRRTAAALGEAFKSRATKKVYWALVRGVPKPHQGRISTYLVKDKDEAGDDKMRVARHGTAESSHAVTYYAVVEAAAQRFAWLSMKPVTGRTHQLRVHTAYIGHPIIGDPKYFEVENWELPGGLQNRLHLHARRLVLPHPAGGTIDVTAPLPPHMRQSWSLLGLDERADDPIEHAPEE